MKKKDTNKAKQLIKAKRELNDLRRTIDIELHMWAVDTCPFSAGDVFLLKSGERVLIGISGELTENSCSWNIQLEYRPNDRRRKSEIMFAYQEDLPHLMKALKKAK